MQDPPGVVQPRQVVEGGWPAAEHLVQLGVQPGLHFREFGEDVEGPGHGVAGSLRPADEEGHDLVVDLLVGQPVLGLLVTGRDQDRQQVAVVRPGPALELDGLPDDPVHARADLVEPAVAGRGEFRLPAERRDHPLVDTPHDDRHAVGDLGDDGALADRGREHGAGGDPQRQGVHRVADVEGPVVLPLAQDAVDLLLHQLDVARHPGGVERGLEHPPLLAVVLPHGADEPVAHEQPCLLEQRAALVEGPRVHQDLRDHLRMAGQVGPARPEPDLDEVALCRERGQELQRPTPQLEGVAEQRCGAWGDGEGAGLLLRAPTGGLRGFLADGDTGGASSWCGGHLRVRHRASGRRGAPHRHRCAGAGRVGVGRGDADRGNADRGNADRGKAGRGGLRGGPGLRSETRHRGVELHPSRGGPVPDRPVAEVARRQILELLASTHQMVHGGEIGAHVRAFSERPGQHLVARLDVCLLVVCDQLAEPVDGVLQAESVLFDQYPDHGHLVVLCVFLPPGQQVVDDDHLSAAVKVDLDEMRQDVAHVHGGAVLGHQLYEVAAETVQPYRQARLVVGHAVGQF